MSQSSHFLPTAAALMPLPEASDALLEGTQVGEFQIREVIGVGGFGIVYLAWEPALEREVALKEYMPMGLVGRGAGTCVALRSRAYEADFTLGLRSFVNEARLLARFDHPALVKVHRFWEDNGTAYMAMPYYKAQTLRQRRQEMGLQPPTQAWLLSMIEPLLGALAEMHRADVYHRDIAPDNILWCADNRPVLLDFGAARHVLADRTQSLTAILKPQFAPIEQYADAGAMRQGPWTDIFALASTCYFMLTGRPPLPATARILSDELIPLAQLAPPGFSSQLLATLDWAMSVRPEDRPQSVTTLWEALHGHLKVPPRAVVAIAPRSRGVEAAASFERTIQTDARAPASWTRPRVPRLSRLGTLVTAVVAPAGGSWLRTLASGLRPNQWLLLALAAVSAGTLAWLDPWHKAAEPAQVAVALPASTTAASAPVLAPQPASTTHPAAPPMPSSSGVAAVVPVRHAEPRETCLRTESSNVAACVRRLCASEPRFRKTSACTRLQAQETHWWQFRRPG